MCVCVWGGGGGETIKLVSSLGEETNWSVSSPGKKPPVRFFPPGEDFDGGRN